MYRLRHQIEHDKDLGFDGRSFADSPVVVDARRSSGQSQRP
jgi:hypothetical protein